MTSLCLPWELYHGALPPVCLVTDTGSSNWGKNSVLYSSLSHISHFTLPKKPQCRETKIIQSGCFHGFHFLLIALPALRGHSPRCRAGQWRCRLHLHNGPNSRWDYQQRHLHKAITLGRAPEPCNMSNAVIAQRSSHLAPLAACYRVWACLLCCDKSWQGCYTSLFLAFTFVARQRVFTLFVNTLYPKITSLCFKEICFEYRV